MFNEAWFQRNCLDLIVGTEPDFALWKTVNHYRLSPSWDPYLEPSDCEVGNARNCKVSFESYSNDPSREAEDVTGLSIETANVRTLFKARTGIVVTWLEREGKQVGLSYPNGSRAFIEKVTVAQPLKKLFTNSVALVRERTIPTERPLLVGEVSANLCG
jgi:hypothetical protein